jgi:Flp pilus assembly protein TadD
VTWAAFAPRGDRIGTIGTDETARLWPVDLLGAAESARPRPLTAAEKRDHGLASAAEREAVDLVAASFEALLVLADVEARLRDEPAITEPLRAAALSLARQRGDRPWRLAASAWAVVRAGGSTDAARQLALRQAEAAVRLVPDHAPFLRVLGAARFRAGRLRDARVALAEADRLEPDSPGTLALLAMACHALGEPDAARAIFGRLEALAVNLARSADGALVQEARELVLGASGRR